MPEEEEKKTESKFKKPKLFRSSVRARQKSTRASTQRFLPIAEIRNDTVFLKIGGGMRAVLEIEAINFNLKSDIEQQGIIAGYGGFVNTINFPLQIVVRSMPTNIDPYIAHLKSLGKAHRNQLLKYQTLKYVEFIEAILESSDIMQKRFFVIIPLDQSERKKSFVEKFFSWVSYSDDSIGKVAQRSREFKKNNTKLKERVELIETGLVSIGLRVQRLETSELIDLYYQIFNPGTADLQKLPANIDIMNIRKDVL